MGQIIVNNAATYISGAITDVATSVTLLDATDFPDPGADYYLVTLVSISEVTGREDNWEIVKVTDKVGSVLTIERAQEGTTAQAWPTNTPIEMRITAGSMTFPDNVAITGGSIDGTPIGASTASTGVFTNLDADTVQLTGGSGAQGTLSWNSDEETLDLIQDGAVLQVGQEIHYHVRNTSGGQITNGTPVMVTGTIGASGRLAIAPMDASDFANEMMYIGVATEDIADGTDGKVTYFGKVRSVNTAGFTEGDILYLDPVNPGAFVTTEPSYGIKQPVAIVINAAANGTIFVRFHGSVGVHDLHDVQLTSISAGEILKYDGTKWLNNTLSEAGIASSSHTHATITWGAGLSGTSYNGSLATTVALDFAELFDMTADISGTTEFILQNGTTESRKAAGEIKLSAFTNDLDVPAIVSNLGSPALNTGVNASDVRTVIGAGTGTVSTLADLSITATATELNYVDGVTSSVQTQLDAKVAKTAAVFDGSVEEQEYNLTGTVIDPANGTIQYKTLSANTQLTENLTNGEYVTLMIDDGTGFTITWPTITWVNGSAPTLSPTGYNVIELWQVNNIVYGAFVGAA